MKRVLVLKCFRYSGVIYDSGSIIEMLSDDAEMAVKAGLASYEGQSTDKQQNAEIKASEPPKKQTKKKN